MERVNPPELARPVGFAHAVVADRAARCSWPARPALDADGRIVGDGVVAQFEQALAQPAHRAAGGGRRAGAPGQLTIYIVDMDDYRAHAREIGAVWRRLVGTEYPARPASAWPGCGTPRRWWRCRGSRSCPEPGGISPLPVPW